LHVCVRATHETERDHHGRHKAYSTSNLRLVGNRTPTELGGLRHGPGTPIATQSCEGWKLKEKSRGGTGRNSKVLEGLFSSTTIPVLEQVAAFSQTRHQVLAGNIANLDTPGYRTRDLSTAAFEERLHSAIEARDQQGQSISFSGSRYPYGNPVDKVQENLNSILFHDDSNVGIEQQVAEISKNQMQHNLALTLLSSQFRLLQAAISERA